MRWVMGLCIRVKSSKDGLDGQGQENKGFPGAVEDARGYR